MYTSTTKTVLKKRANLLMAAMTVAFSFIVSAATAAPPVSGTKTVGAGGDYPNLTIAFADINANGISGAILELQLIAGYPAAPETYPITITTVPGTLGHPIQVYPVVPGLSITSSNPAGTLRFDNGYNIDIDGRVNRTGFTPDLVISNTNVGASPALVYTNDAIANIIRYCKITSRNNSTASGTVFFGTTTGLAPNGTHGNSFNTITSSIISDDGSGSFPVNAVYSVGTTTSTDLYNAHNDIYNSNIYNFFSATTASNGICLGNGNSDWDIEGNSLYQTASRTYTAGNTHCGINISSPVGGNNFIVSFNNLGGTAPNAAGSPYTMTGNVQSLFRGISLNVDTTSVSTIEGNMIQNIVFNTSSQSFNNPGFFSSICVFEGKVDIGTLNGNTIGSATGTGSVVVSTNSGFSGRIELIFAQTSSTINIHNNTIGSVKTNTSSAGQLLDGIYTLGTGYINITSNKIGSTTTANSIMSGTAASTSVTAELHGIYGSGQLKALNISNNTISNLTANVLTSGSTYASVVTGIYTAFIAADIANITNNTISNIKSGGPNGLVVGINFGSSPGLIDGNIVSNLSGTTSGFQATQVRGIYDFTGAAGATISNNQVFNLSISGSTQSTSNIISGLTTDPTFGSTTVHHNIAHDFTFTNSSVGAVTISGIETGNSGSTVTVYKNKCYNFTATNGALSEVYGIHVTGTNNEIYNNLVSGLTATAGSEAGVSVAALYIDYGETVNVYNNTFLISGSGGTNFLSSAIYMSAYATSISLRNNIIVNNCTASGTGKAIALMREAEGLSNYAAISDNNLFYAGTPSSNHLIFYDGTNAYQTMASFKTLASTRDQASVTENPSFLSTTGSNANFLHINTSISTLIEGGAIPVSGLTDDYDGDARNTNTPDIGADEFAGTGITRIKINIVSANLNGNQCTATARIITANVTAGLSSITSVTLKYSVNFGAYVSVAMTGGTTASGSTSDWIGTIPASGNSNVDWYVTAIDNVTANSRTGISYKDAPLTGYTATANASLTTVCAGSPTNLSVVLSKPSATVGSGGFRVGAAASVNETPFGQYYESSHAQYLYTAADIIAGGLNAGNITSLAFNITTKNSTKPYTGYTIKLASTNVSNLFTMQTGSFTQVYQSATTINTGYSSVAGLNTFVFGNGVGSSSTFNWDGTSNIIVDICFANDPGSTGVFYSNSDVVSASETSYAASYNVWEDNVNYCGATTGNSTVSSVLIPVITFTGNTSRNISSLSWSDGTNIVGTNNPQTVTPNITTSYTTTVIDPISNCPATSNAVTVTTTPRPTAVISGGATYCSDAVVATTLNIALTGTAPWSGTLSDGTPFSGNTSPISISVSPASTTIYTFATLNDANCISIPADLTGSSTVTINQTPATPTIASNGPTTFCSGGSVILTSSSATGNQWNVEGTPIAGETNQNLTVTGTGNYSVTVSNGICTATSLITTVTVNNSLTAPAVSIVQPTCAVATATVTVTTPTGAGITYTLDGGQPQGSVTFNIVAGGSHVLLAQNGSGCSSSTTINVDPQPTAPTAPTVNGITNICPYVGTGTQITYTANTPGATSYTWSLPAGVNLISGAGTASIVVTFPDPSIISQNYKQIKVRAISACGTSSQTIFYLLTQFPVTPAAITASSTDICSIIGTGNTITYTIPRANSAISYLWVVQQGTATINHPNGSGINDTIVTVSFADNFSTSAITVTGVNDCGLSGTRSFMIVKGTPSTPSLISGPTNACSNVTPGVPATYTIAPVIGASAYNWTVPANAIGLSGQGTNTISFTYPQGFTNGVISVTASNGCGTSAGRTLSVTTLTPSTPGIIDVINTISCPNRQYTYAISSYPLNTNSLLWTVPTASGAVLVSGQNTTSITVSYPSSQVSGAVTVQALNSCANSGVRSVALKLPACPQSVTFTKGEIKTNSMVTEPTVSADGMNVNVSPNPTVNEFKLQVIAAGKEKIAVNILDLQGRICRQLTVLPYQTINLGADLKPGIYMIEARQGKQIKTTKLIKF